MPESTDVLLDSDDVPTKQALRDYCRRLGEDSTLPIERDKLLTIVKAFQSESCKALPLFSGAREDISSISMLFGPYVQILSYSNPSGGEAKQEKVRQRSVFAQMVIHRPDVAQIMLTSSNLLVTLCKKIDIAPRKYRILPVLYRLSEMDVYTRTPLAALIVKDLVKQLNVDVIYGVFDALNDSVISYAHVEEFLRYETELLLDKSKSEQKQIITEQLAKIQCLAHSITDEIEQRLKNHADRDKYLQVDEGQHFKYALEVLLEETPKDDTGIQAFFTKFFPEPPEEERSSVLATPKKKKPIKEVAWHRNDEEFWDLIDRCADSKNGLSVVSKQKILDCLLCHYGNQEDAAKIIEYARIAELSIPESFSIALARTPQTPGKDSMRRFSSDRRGSIGSFRGSVDLRDGRPTPGKLSFGGAPLSNEEAEHNAALSALLATQVQDPHWTVASIGAIWEACQSQEDVDFVSDWLKEHFSYMSTINAIGWTQTTQPEVVTNAIRECIKKQAGFFCRCATSEQREKVCQQFVGNDLLGNVQLFLHGVTAQLYPALGAFAEALEPAEREKINHEVTHDDPMQTLFKTFPAWDEKYWGWVPDDRKAVIFQSEKNVMMDFTHPISSRGDSDDFNKLFGYYQTLGMELFWSSINKECESFGINCSARRFEFTEKLLKQDSEKVKKLLGTPLGLDFVGKISEEQIQTLINACPCEECFLRKNTCWLINQWMHDQLIQGTAEDAPIRTGLRDGVPIPAWQMISENAKIATYAEMLKDRDDIVDALNILNGEHYSPIKYVVDIQKQIKKGPPVSISSMRSATTLSKENLLEMLDHVCLLCNMGKKDDLSTYISKKSLEKLREAHKNDSLKSSVEQILRVIFMTDPVKFMEELSTPERRADWYFVARYLNFTEMVRDVTQSNAVAPRILLTPDCLKPEYINSLSNYTQKNPSVLPWLKDHWDKHEKEYLPRKTSLGLWNDFMEWFGKRVPYDDNAEAIFQVKKSEGLFNGFGAWWSKLKIFGGYDRVNTNETDVSVAPEVKPAIDISSSYEAMGLGQGRTSQLPDSLPQDSIDTKYSADEIEPVCCLFGAFFSGKSQAAKAAQSDAPRDSSLSASGSNLHDCHGILT